MAADYYIYKVHYKDNNTSTYIDEVRTSPTGNAKSRSTVVKDIEDKKTVKTAVYDKNDEKYYEGKDVHVITVDGSKYLRTDKNNIKRDNLENLPTYDK